MSGATSRRHEIAAHQELTLGEYAVVKKRGRPVEGDDVDGVGSDDGSERRGEVDRAFEKGLAGAGIEEAGDIVVAVDAGIAMIRSLFALNEGNPHSTRDCEDPALYLRPPPSDLTGAEERIPGAARSRM